MTYNLRPEIKIKHAAQTWNNYDEIAEELNKQFNDGKKTITLECYPGVNLLELEKQRIPTLLKINNRLYLKIDRCSTS